jgi:hypothetical protein
MNGQSLLLLSVIAVTLAAMPRRTASAEEEKGYWVKHAGMMRNVMQKHDYSAHFDMATLKKTPHLYALGPVEGLNGEITVFDSKPSVAIVHGGKIKVEESFPKAAFLVYGQVTKWQEVSLPLNVTTMEQLETSVGKAAQEKGLDAEKPFPFLVKGTAGLLSYHIVSKGEHVPFQAKAQPVEVLGFYSTHDQGVFVHHGTNIHLHFRTKDENVSGHIDDLTLKPGAVLLLPVKGS